MTALCLVIVLLHRADVEFDVTARVTVVRDRYEVVCERLKTLKLGMTLKEVDAHVGVRPDGWDGWLLTPKRATVCWVDLSGDGPRGAEVEFIKGVVTAVRFIRPPADPVLRQEYRERLQGMIGAQRRVEWPPKKKPTTGGR